MTELFFHHARGLEHVEHGEIEGLRLLDILAEPECAEGCPRPFASDPWHEALDYDAAYQWMAERAGFWPLWLAVGTSEEAVRMTGYDGQFARLIARSRAGNTYRKVGESPNIVLFSWSSAPPHCCFSDYSNWHLVLNSIDRGPDPHHPSLRPISTGWERQILRRSWSATRWLRYSERSPGAVQAVAPTLNLAEAERVCCRNEKTRRALIAMGFDEDRVRVMRLPVRIF